MSSTAFQRLNWLWVLAYTTGLPETQKRDRRDLIQSDMYEEAAFAAQSGTATLAQQRQVASRMLRGVAGDIAWRWEAGREAERVVRDGMSPPMPWLSSIFLSAIIAFGAVATTQVAWWGDSRVSLAIIGMFGAAMAWLGLYLSRHSHLGPLLVAAGSACIAWSLWWTLIVPVLAVAVSIVGVERAHRLERLARAC
ncbi:MAG: hypothetical protein AB7N24_13685 [Dehalococcoidia bacterium]